MPLDFERLGDFLDQAGAPPEEAPSGDERRPVPRNKAGRIDFEAVWDVGSHASELATHRWKTLRNAEQTNTMPVMGAKGKTELVSPDKLIKKPKHPAKKDALSDYFGQDLAPGPSMAGNALKDVANMALAPADIAQLGVKGGINMLQGKWNKGGERLTLAAEKTGELAKGMLEYPIQAIGKTAGAVIDDMMPMLGPQLHKLGMSREDFNRAFHDNPLMMALTVVGGPSWLKEKITKAGGGGGGTPPGAFDEVAANEAMRDAKAAQEGHETAKKAQEQGRGAIEEDWREKMWRLALEAEQAKRDAQFGEEGRQAAWQAPTMYPTLDPATGEVRLRPQASPEGVVPEGVAASGQAMGEGLEPYPANTPQAPGYNKAQQAADLNTGAIESLDPNLPNNTQAWSMDTGFRPTNLLENQGIEPGLGYTESEATIRQLQAVDQLRRTKGGAYDPNDTSLSGFDEPPGARQRRPPLNDREVAEKARVIKQVLDRAEKGRTQKKAKVEYDKAKAQYEAENEARADTHEQNRRDYANRKGKYRYDRSGERGSIDPQVFQDLYDLGAHVLRTARDYAGWALDMTKRIAKLPKEWLEELWKILRGKADESIERRTDPEQRANITQQIDDIRQAGLSHVTALDDIAARRAKGEIDGPTESRLIREANNQYSKALIGEPTPYEPSGGGLTQAELAELNEFQRLRDEKLKRSEGASFGPLPDEPKGPTLGSLGSQELYERTVNAATKVGKLIYRVANNFDDWSARVRFEAKRNGLDITDQQLREAWDSPEMTGVRPKETDQSVGSAAAEAVASGTEDTAASRWAGRPTWQSIRDAAANYLGDAKGQDWANATVNMFRDAWNSGLGTAPGFTRLHEYIPAAYEAATRVVTSYMDAFMRTRNHYNTLDTILETKGLRNSFADLINDDRARGLEASAQGRDARMDQIKNIEIPQAILEEDHRKVLTLESEFEELAETPKDHRVPKLDDQQRQLLLANPKIQAAIKYWTETMIPEIEGLSTDIGINRRFQGPLGLYSKMRWIDPFEELSHQFRDRELGRPQTSIGSGSPYDVRPKSPLSGKRATGLGPVGKTPENSLFHIIYNTYERRLAAKNLEAFRQTIRDNAIMKESENKGKFVQPFTEINGRKEPVKALTLERLSGVNEDIYHIPEMLKDVHDQIRGTRGRDALWKAFDKINNAATLQVVIMPAEAIRHGFNVIQVMTTIGQAKGFWSTPEAALSASTLGISRMANAMYKAFNLSGPEFAAQLRDMAEGGALRMRGYEGFDPRQKPLVTRLAEKVPGLHQLKDSVFGDPGTTKGLGGMETRLRAVLWNMLKEDQPGLGNAELGRQVNDAMGTYVSKMESPLARAFQGVDPFVRAGATLTKGGFRAAIGKDVTGRFNPNNLLAVYGTLLAAQYYSKKLDDKDEWPWEKANWKPTQLLTFDRGGKRYSFSMSDVVNPLSRAANFSGARALVESVLNGETKGSNIAEDYIRGVNNAIRSRYGPIIRSIGILRKNELPYELSDGSMLPASSPSMAGSNVSPFGERMKALATSTLPVPSKLDPLRQAVMGQEELTGKEILPDSYLAKVFWKVNDIFKFPYVPTIHEQVNYKIPKAQYRTQNQYEDTLNDIVRRARNIPEDKRDEFITREILGKDGKGGRFTEELISVYGKSKPARWAALEEVYRRLAGREGAAAKGMARQQANTAR